MKNLLVLSPWAVNILVLKLVLPENLSVPEEIIFEIISETAFLHGGWEELI